MKLTWFKQIGIFFVPVALIGWLLLLSALVYFVDVFFEIDTKSHSVSDTLMNFAFRLLIVGVLYSLIGYLTSRKL
jgi:hypothetical protein